LSKPGETAGRRKQTVDLTLREERTIVDGLRRGSEAAFHDLYRHFSTKLVGLFYRMTGDRDLANDLFQETMIKIFEGIKTFREESRLYTWIYRVARNVALAHLRKKQPDIGKMDVSVQVAATGQQTPEETILSKARVQHLTRCINSLDPEDRIILALKLQTGMKYRKIAEITGTSPGAVRIRMFRIRERLREQLDRW